MEVTNETPRPISNRTGTSGFSKFASSSDHEHALSEDLSAHLANLPHRNLLDNSHMSVVQRGTSVLSGSNIAYIHADRWQQEVIAGAFTVNTTVETFDAPASLSNTRSLKIQGTSALTLGANQYVLLRQNLEESRVYPINFGTSYASPLVATFWVKANQTGIYTFELENLYSLRRITRSFTITDSLVWQKITIAIPPDTGGSKIPFGSSYGFSFNIWLAGHIPTYGALDREFGWTTFAASGTSRIKDQVNCFSTINNSFWFTGAQLEVGTTPTPLETVPRIQTVTVCRRYLNVLGGGGNLFETVASGMAISTTDFRMLVPLPVPMRTSSPGVFWIAPFRVIDANLGIYPVTGMNPVAPDSSANFLNFQVLSSSAYVTGRPGWLGVDNSSTARLVISSET
jgi:hypothetical protein